MRQTSFAAIAALLAGLVAAEPRARHGGQAGHHHHARRGNHVVMVTVTHTQITTHTKTVWVDPSAPTDQVKAKAYGEQDSHQYDQRPQKKKQSKPAKHQPVVQNLEKKQQDQPVQYTPPTDQPAQVQPDQVKAAAVEPAQGQTPEEIQQHNIDLQQQNIEKQNKINEEQMRKNGQPVPAPQQQYNPPTVPQDQYKAPVVPSSTVLTTPAPSGGGGGGGSGLSSTPGIMTFYDPENHAGACGWGIAQDAPQVALAASMMGDKAKCGMMINIKGPAGTFPAKVADKCERCETDAGSGINHIDVPREYAAVVAGQVWKGAQDFESSQLYLDGHLNGVTWEWA